MATGMKIFYSVLAVGMFLFAVFLFNMKTTANDAVLLMPVFIIAGAVLIGINIIRRKVILYNDSVLCINLFSTKEIAIKDIKGCRIGQKAIIVEPISADDPKITISNCNDFGHSSDLKKYFQDNFKDLDAIDLENDKAEILQDSSLGFTQTDREAALKKAKIIAIVYNVAGIIAGFGVMILFSDKVLTVILMAYPLLGIIIMAYSNGLIKFLSNPKRSIHPYTMLGFMGPVIVMLVSALNSYDIFKYTNIWIPFIAISSPLFLLLYFFGINKTVKAVKGQVVVMLVLALIYGFGSTIQINCAFDNSKLQVYDATILDHRMEHGKSNSYYLTLSPWGPMQQADEVDIHSRLYYNTAIGDIVKVNFNQGLLHIPWFVVTKN